MKVFSSVSRSMLLATVFTGVFAFAATASSRPAHPPHQLQRRLLRPRFLPDRH